jgi:hypothetical protein
MKLDIRTIDKFFKYADKVLKDKDIYLMIELDNIVPIEKYRSDLRINYSYLTNKSFFSAKEQIEGFLLPKINQVDKFISEFEKEFPDLVDDSKDDNVNEDVWESQMNADMKELGL